LRLVEVPDAAPPYDCPIHGPRCPARAGDAERAGQAEAAEPPAPGDRDPGVRAGQPTADPTTALALVIVEALAGARPERQLVPLTTDRVRAHIRGLAPLLRCDQRPRIQRLVASRPAPRVVELTAVARFGPRSRALALRFEHAAGRPAAAGWPARPARWLCTAIQVG
jgi:hypothetical protein